MTAALAAWGAFLWPKARPMGHLPEEHRHALDILARHGRDSLNPFALRDDKSLHFADEGFLAYRVLRETAVVSGDPIGPPGSAARIIDSFMGYARRRGWDVVLTGASDRYLADYRELGLCCMRIGEEAVVDPSSFSLEGREIRKVRQSVARVARRGWTVEVVEGRHMSSGPAAVELAELEAEWHSEQRRVSGFAMTLGRLAGEEEDEDSVYVLGRDPSGALRSFLRFAAFRDGLSLDLMRRSGDEPNGLTEALVVAAIEHARATGAACISLNFAGFAHVMAPGVPLTWRQRLLRLLLRSVHGRFQLERLVRFNSKFKPAWQARHLVYRSPRRLPRAALRVLQAEDYVRGPRSSALEGRWQSRPSWPDLAEPVPRKWSRRPRPSLAWAAATTMLAVGVVLPGQLFPGNPSTAVGAAIHVSQAIPVGTSTQGGFQAVCQGSCVSGSTTASAQTLEGRIDRMSSPQPAGVVHTASRERRIE